MALTKADIIDSIYNQCGFSKSKSTELAEAILETMKMNLESGEDILISSSVETFTSTTKVTDKPMGKVVGEP